MRSVRPRHTHRRRAGAAVLALGLVLSAAACSSESPSGEPTPVPTPTATDTGAEEPTGSMFTDNGTFTSSTSIDGIEYVLSIYPTARTPFTHQWYPGGDKLFTMSMTAYDTDRAERDPFASKRVVFLDRVSVSSVASDESGNTISVEPYRLDEQAARVTLDPEPLADPVYGMVITSPKGAFELRDQVIGTLDPKVRKVTLSFHATVWAQNSAGSAQVNRQSISTEVPIVIFPSTKDTTTVENPDAD
ncbi:MAG: hypothetical protein P1U38_03735 [Aeromicrobium sp.]|uniref:hypothetical protein n=1 Tax=Aeromicrobium sp. TaxID=1871063 RepID=UPI0026344EEC|nr:hypothetical protein [Aeromicrobium sp.]MDF1703860.1 hypothetical protein [Aeromicrobium sp.]